MTLRLTDEEQDSLRRQAEAEGISVQEAALRPSLSSADAVDVDNQVGLVASS